MDQESLMERLVGIWGDIGDEKYWSDPAFRRSPFVPFQDRWPQPGYVGREYSEGGRIVLIGQNPRASNKACSDPGDLALFDAVRRHASVRTVESLRELFDVARPFMLGLPPAAYAAGGKA